MAAARWSPRCWRRSAGSRACAPAEPGEFTRRAFENGRIDLAEAEGLADLLEAETEVAAPRRAWRWRAARSAARSRPGRRGCSRLAAAGRGGARFLRRGRCARRCRADFGARVARAWRASWRRGSPGRRAERLRDGVRVVIAGPPNAGKSSLLNALAGRDAAITSAIPGTTRDLIEAPTAIGGMPFLLIDTAGPARAGDEVETIGVARAQALGRGGRHRALARRAGRGAASGAILRPLQGRSRPARGAEADVSVSAMTGEGLDGADSTADSPFSRAAARPRARSRSTPATAPRSPRPRPPCARPKRPPTC